MRNKFIFIMTLFSAVICLFAGMFYLGSRQQDIEDIQAQQILAVNEMEQLAVQGNIEEMKAKSKTLQDSLRFSEHSSHGDTGYLVLGVICVAYVIVVFGYMYFSILKPFDKMKDFAGEIAKGNFDVPLRYERSNYFGNFTWAFDSMRREITKLRSSEREAIENNKTVIATLSHDIKTPIASIRAYAEGLEANMDCSAEKREKYISVIMKKCDEVAHLTNDLFLHSISDLDKLKISAKQLALCDFLRNAVSEIAGDHDDVRLTLPDKEVMVSVDENRLMQVCENLINNARKYAKTNIDVTVDLKDEGVSISFRDYGDGILDEDMPFIFGKFYRGKNCGKEQGSGLGLYIVKYIMEKQGGSVLLHNHEDGLEAVLMLPVLEA